MNGFQLFAFIIVVFGLTWFGFIQDELQALH